MKIKTRLFLYNILIILISSLLLVLVFAYMNKSSSEILYDVETITIDENAETVKRIMINSFSDQIMDINLRRFGYKLYIYENNKLIYGESNSALNKLLNNYHIKGNFIRTIFVDNKTTVMEVYNNRVYFAMQDKSFKRDIYPFNDTYNPLQNLFTKMVFIILISLIIILGFAIFFSNRILKRVMEPVNLLIKGAERVQDGNFSEKIIYNNNDEFSSVINNFNDMQESLKEKTEKAKNYEKAKKEMINGISHDIRTPLTVVKGNIKGIQDGIASTKEKRSKYLSIAYNRVLDIENLLNRLFDTFKYETDELKLSKERVNVSNYVTEIVKSNENVINKVVNINIEMLVSDDDIYIDKIQFKRIFDNLINNSIKHNSDKKDLTVEIKIWKEDNLIKIGFKDNGKGVKEENINRIFNEFFKEDESRNNDKSSSGLGLFIVKRIVESHDGTIIAENRDGLYFEITLERIK